MCVPNAACQHGCQAHRDQNVDALLIAEIGTPQHVSVQSVHNRESDSRQVCTTVLFHCEHDNNILSLHLTLSLPVYTRNMH